MSKKYYFHKPIWRLLLVALVFVLCGHSVRQGKVLYGADLDEAKEGAVSRVETSTMSFSRVYVPSGRLSDVIRDETRYIPMDVDEFDKVVQRLLPRDTRRAFETPQPVAEYVLYEMKLDESGSLLGDVSVRLPGRGGEFEVFPGEALFQNSRWLNQEVRSQSSIDRLQESAELQPPVRLFKPDGIPVDLFGKPDGSIEFQVPGAGMVFANLRVLPERADRSLSRGVSLSVGQSSFLFPRIPSLSTTLVLDLPKTAVPMIVGNVPSTDKVDDNELDSEQYCRWRYELGPRRLLNLTLSPRRASRCSVWSSVFVGERTVEIGTVILPETVWSERSLRLMIDKQVTVMSAQTYGDGLRQVSKSNEMDVRRESNNTISVLLPATLIGTKTRILVRSVISSIHQGKERLQLPGVTIDPELWVGGGFFVDVENSLQVSNVATGKCLAMAPEKAMEWPRVANFSAGTRNRLTSHSGVPGFVFEQQDADGSCGVSVVKRQPDFDVARVTTVDVSSASLIGRAACDIHVRRGSVHSVVGRIGKEWFIDSVEPLIAEKALVQRGVETEQAIPDRVQSDVGNVLGAPYEWKVVRGKNGNQLVLDLPRAIRDGDSLRIRITGHRRGVPAGAQIHSTDADMIQLAGEVSEQAWIDLRTSPETTLIKIEGPKNEPLFGPRLTLLAEQGVWRQRVAGGRLATPEVFRFLRRRPPLEVLAQSQFTVRGNQFSETYSFSCQAFQGELDAVTVHFSEPVGDLDWSILSDSETTAIARRLNTSESHVGAEPNNTKRSIKESWLVELNPPVRGATTLRATGKRDFTEQTAIPLVWIESAISPQGRIAIQSARGSRPTVINHGLVQLPPLAGQSNLPIQSVMELLYDESALAQTGPSVEVLPVPNSVQSVARAWVWRESVRVRCYASANAEYETTFIIENDGRQSVTVSLPKGHRLIGLEVQDESIPLQSSNVREFPVYLPSGRQRVFVTVRTVVAADFSQGIWRLSSVVPAVDAPTLTREMQVAIPKDVRLIGVPSGYTEIFKQKTDWIERLSGLSQRESWFASTSPEAASSGFDSRWFVPTSGRYQPRFFLLVNRWLLAASALCVAVAAMWLSLSVFWRSSWLLVAGVVVASVAALWVPQPFDLIARASLWGMLAAVGFRVWMYGRAKKQVSFVALVWMFSGACSYGAEVPLQVFLTPVDGETTALVPEPLYRVLVGTSAAQSSGVRVLKSKMELPSVRGSAIQNETEIWHLNLLIETDSAEVFSLDQSPVGGRFANEPFLLNGGSLSVSLSANRNQARLSLPAGGRHSLVVPVEPARTRRGDIEICEVCLPTSPQTVVAMMPPNGIVYPRDWSGGVQCEWSNGQGVFRPAQEIVSLDSRLQRFRVPPAERLRVIRSLDPKETVTTIVHESKSKNQITWTPNGIGLVAEFIIDGGNAILPSFWIQADPRLVFAKSQDDENAPHIIGGFEVQSLGRGIYRVDRTELNTEKMTFRMSFHMPLINLTGKYELPYAWVRGVERDTRESVLTSYPGISIDVQFPQAVAPPQVNEVQDDVLQWITELIKSGDESFSESSSDNVPEDNVPEDRLDIIRLPFALQRQAAYVEVSREQNLLRGTQQIEIVERADKNYLVFEATIDSSQTVWLKDRISIPKGYRLEACQVFEKKSGSTSLQNECPLDISLQKEKQDAYGLTLQQPRSGIFLLRVQASSNGQLRRKGVLPLVQSASASDFPYSVIWGGGDQRANLTILGDQQVSEFDTAQKSQLNGRRRSLPAVRVSEDSQSSVWRVELPSNDTVWSYQSEIQTGHELVERSELAPVSAEVDSSVSMDSVLTVPLIDIEVIVDERGRISGICCIELPMTAPEVRVRVPAGFRVYEMLLDGQQVQPQTPRRDSPAEVWAVPIQAGSWPHELVFVFVGEFEATTMQGEPVSLALPSVVGMPVEQVLWTINHPMSRSIRFAGLGDVLNEFESRDIRTNVQTEIDELVTTISPALPKGVGTRLSEFRLSRQKQDGVPPLEAWVSGTADTSEASPIARQFSSAFLASNRWKKLIIQPQSARGVVTIRFADSPLSRVGRAVATLVVLVLGAWGCWGVAKFADVMLALANRWWPAIAGVIAVGWIIYREPAWPGFMLLFLATGAGLGRLLDVYSGQEHYSLAADQPTVQHGAKHGVSASSSTRVGANMHESSTITHYESGKGVGLDP